MPELPEVETTVNGIRPWVHQKQIKNINIYNPSLRWKIPDNLQNKYLNEEISTVERRAKYILIHLKSGSTLIIHLGMSGSLTVITDNRPLLKHDHFELILDDNTIIRYNDPRRFGCLLESDNFSNHKLIKGLGPEPLNSEFDGHYLKQKSINKSQAVKNFIMDGKIVVGVGNIYASESLFKAGIRPDRAASKISIKRYEKLAESIKQVLTVAIQSGGTTLKDFVNADGKPGYFAQKLNVYGRKDLPCYICESPVQMKTIGQRSTFYCIKCQR